LHTTTENGRGHRRAAVVKSILADVFSGRVRAGDHLVTQDLADRFKVSHTPIREALIALSGMGIIDLLPNRGAVVRRISVQEVKEVCQVRRVLECEATRLACGRISLADLDGLANDLRKMKGIKNPGPSMIPEARDLDTRLHDLIAECCGNTFLAHEIGRLKMLFRAFRDVAWEHDEARNDYRRLAQESGEHLAIVEALRKGDPRSARRAMSQHIRSGIRYWSRALPARPVESNGRPSANGQKKRSRR
jgi:DNA-binding GntR family transcriptional regulator